MAQHTIRLGTLACQKQEDLLGPDEALLNVYIDGNLYKSFRRDLKRHESFPLNEEVAFDSKVLLQLYDEDSPDPDDFLGEITITAANLSGNDTFREDQAVYTIDWIELRDIDLGSGSATMRPGGRTTSGNTPDGKKPVFPIVKDASGARGYAKVQVEDDGVATLHMKVDTPAGGTTTRYVATVLITGYKDNDFNNVLTDKVETHSLTLGSNPLKDSDKEDSWLISSVKPEDARNIRHVRVLLYRDKSEPDLLHQVITVFGEVGEAWDAADSLYKKVKHSELGQDVAVVLMTA